MTDLPFLVPLVMSAWKVVEFVHIFKSGSSFCFFITSITYSYLFPPKNNNSWPLSSAVVIFFCLFVAFKGLISRKKCHSWILCPQIREISPFLVNKGELWGTSAHDPMSSDVQRSDANEKWKGEGEINWFFFQHNDVFFILEIKRVFFQLVRRFEVQKIEVPKLLRGEKWKKEINILRFLRKNKETTVGAFNVVFDEESNGGLENAVARTVPEIQAKGTKLNFFTINLRFLRKNEETRYIQCSFRWEIQRWAGKCCSSNGSRDTSERHKMIQRHPTSDVIRHPTIWRFLVAKKGTRKRQLASFILVDPAWKFGVLQPWSY